MTSRWLVRPQVRPFARFRLFCFPYAGAGAAVYRPWSAELPADVELCAVQLPGRETRLREAAVESVPELVDAMFEAIEPLLDREFAFFGHSMGGCLAYELTRRLRSAGRPLPAQLFVSGRRAPTIEPTDPPLHRLDDDEFLAEIRRRYNGIPDEVMQHPELMALLLPCLRADIKALELHSHQPAAPLDCPIHALGGAHDPCVSAAELGAWRDETTGGFSLRLFPGEHFYLQSSRRPLLDTLTATLRTGRSLREPQPTSA